MIEYYKLYFSLQTFMVSVIWSDGSEIIIYRSFKDFKKFHVSKENIQPTSLQWNLKWSSKWLKSYVKKKKKYYLAIVMTTQVLKE